MSEIVKMGVSGRIHLPKELQSSLELNPGDYVCVEVEKLRMIKAKGVTNGEK